MSNDMNVIWKKGDVDMPEKARQIVEAAQSELLFKTLELPTEIVDAIRHNAEKNAQPVNVYISSVLIERLRTAS